jgi:hypothetical protein
VFLIERYVTGLRGEPVSAVAALGVARWTSSTAADRTRAWMALALSGTVISTV